MLLTEKQVAAVLYACEDNGEMYLEDEDPEIRALGEVLVDLIPALRESVIETNAQANELETEAGFDR